MSIRAPSALRLNVRSRAGSGASGNTGDRVLHGLSAAAGALCVVILVEVGYQIVNGAEPAMSRFGISFVWHSRWAANLGVFGALEAIYGTLMTAAIALVVAAPLGIAIGLYLAMMAPSGVRTVVGPLVEMLAAIPSIIVGFWGVIVLGPFAQKHLEPFLHNTLGFIPLFGTPQTTGFSVFTAGLGLSLMVLPIIAALSRDLFLTVPQELKDGASALGATQWEVIRGVVLPTTLSGVVAATVLGLGRALGESIAVMQMIGDGTGIHSSVFLPGISLASRLASEFPSPQKALDIPSLFYLALILLVIGLATSLLARAITSRFNAAVSLAR